MSFSDRFHLPFGKANWRLMRIRCGKTVNLSCSLLLLSKLWKDRQDWHVSHICQEIIVGYRGSVTKPRKPRSLRTTFATSTYKVLRPPKDVK